MKVVFVSNYLTAHQIPFCLEMQRLLKREYTFVSTDYIPKERIELGWKDETGYDFEIRAYESPKCAELAKQRIQEADFVILGAADICWIKKRLLENKPVFYNTERYYKIKPRWTQYAHMAASVWYRHNRFWNKNLYMLCAGGFVKSDLDQMHAYYKKAYQWGYFPDLIQYDVKELMNHKCGDVIELMWCGRFLEWKHPLMALEAAAFLKHKNIPFHMNAVGSGPLKNTLEAFIQENELDEEVTLHSSMSAESIRRYMEKANIYLAASDRFEGWGTVVNEAMNSGCAVIASNQMGSVPYLIENGSNGFVFESGQQDQLNSILLHLIKQPDIRYNAGVNAYKTIVDTWNAPVAAQRLVRIMESMETDREILFENGPCSQA